VRHPWRAGRCQCRCGCRCRFQCWCCRLLVHHRCGYSPLPFALLRANSKPIIVLRAMLFVSAGACFRYGWPVQHSSQGALRSYIRHAKWSPMTLKVANCGVNSTVSSLFFNYSVEPFPRAQRDALCWHV
jgi:hypothetical protein